MVKKSMLNIKYSYLVEKCDVFTFDVEDLILEILDDITENDFDPFEGDYLIDITFDYLGDFIVEKYNKENLDDFDFNISEVEVKNIIKSIRPDIKKRIKKLKGVGKKEEELKLSIRNLKKQLAEKEKQLTMIV